MNLKEEFIEWIYKNSNPNLSTIGRNTISKNIDDSNDFLDRDIMDVDEFNYKGMIEYLKEELYRNNKAFQEYNASVASGRPRAILGKENYLKFLEEKFDGGKEEGINYFVFQGNPDKWPVIEVLKSSEKVDWNVTAHRDKMKVGDKVILWVTGNNAGCYALGTLTSEVRQSNDDTNENEFEVEVTIERNFSNNSVLWEEIKELPEFQDFKAGNQGTNFSATKEEFESIEELGEVRTKSSYREVKRLLPKEKVESFLKILRNYVEEKDLEPQDERLAFNVRESKRRLVFLIGNRYALNLEKINNKTVISFISPEKISSENGVFHNKKGEIETYWNIVDDISGYEDKVKDGFDVELKRNHKSPFRRFSDPEFVKDVFGRKAVNKRENNKRKYWLYSPGENAEHWEEFYDKGIMGLGWDYIGDLNKYSSKNEIVKKLQEYEDVTSSKKNDATANYQFKREISVGDIVIVKKGRGKLLGYGEVTSDYYYDENRSTFQKCRKVDWKKKGEWETGFQLALKTLTDVTNYPEDIFEYDQYYERLLGIINGHPDDTTHLKIMLPLNQILYGPPGTGKTFKLQNEYFDLFTVSETSLTRSQYLENIVSELKWWQVLSIVLLDLNNAKVNTIIDHDVLKAKIKLSNSKSVNPILWSSLQSHTSLDCPNVGVTERRDPKIFYKDDKSNWSVNKEELEQYYPEAISILKEINDYKPSPERYVKNYEFVTFHQSFSYEDFVEGIKPKMEEQEKEVSYEIQEGIFKKLCNKAKADPENQYAIFIDEINRGNVSSIFGELITLIEDDKRIGEENELTVQLPYSKKEFGIPSNLHVIGTMNTADRSVEALDTALRRRFTFEEIIPLPHLLSNISFTGFKLDEVLETINNRIEVLLDRDHMIGHSYFIKISDGDTVALEQTFQNKIIPLLQEYFYHDYEKIAHILGDGFVNRKIGTVEFASFSQTQIDIPSILPSFELRKEISDIEEAVRKFLNRKDETTE